MIWKWSGRKRESRDSAYIPLDQLGLSWVNRTVGGDGSAKNPWVLEVEILNEENMPWEGVIRFELSVPDGDSRFFMPAFLYGRNKGEEAANIKWFYPRLRRGGVQMPYSPWWMVRSDRLSHPAVFAFEKRRIVGISASPYVLHAEKGKIFWMPGEEGLFYQYAGFGCSLEDGWLCYTLGYENAPKMFVNSDTVRDRSPLGDNSFCLEPGEKICFSLRLFDYPAENESGIADALEEVYYFYHQPPRKGEGIKTAIQDLSEAVMRDAWVEKDKNYATQVYEKEDHTLFLQKWFSISWTGGVEVAVPILMAALRMENKEMRRQAVTCIQNIVDHSLNFSSGLPYDACNDGVWSVDGWWKEHLHARGHTSYLVGQAVYYILKAYDKEKSWNGTKHSDWLGFAEKVIGKMEATKNSDQEYAYILSEKTGAGLEYDSFAGVWCMASAAYYTALTRDKKYLPGIRKSEAHYFNDFLKHMECYGTPLDTDKAVDSEGILAYIKAVRHLHEITGEEIYLNHLRDGLCYEYSFKFCYNSPIKVPPLSRLGWSSCGGSVTSTCNPHIHPMSNNVIDEMLYYLKFREDVYVKSRMEDTIGWGCQTYNTFDGEYDYGRKGWMSERFCHSEALLVEKYPDGSPASTWFALLPWGAANIIEGMVGDYWKLQYGRKERTL